LNTSAWRVVHRDIMRWRAGTSPAEKLGVVLLIALTVFVISVRPLTRATGPLASPLRLTRLSAFEPVTDNDLPLPSSAATGVAPVLAPSSTGYVRVVLKTRRARRRSAPLRRLKLPLRSLNSSLSSD
jgi:hypothetical protein